MDERYITESEMTHLIRLSDRDHFFGCSFGPRFVRLDEIPENEWAMEELRKLRGTAQIAGNHEKP